MARKLTIAMQKGGVGKTATAVHLAYGLAQLGRRTLLVDLDHQGSASVALGVDKEEAAYTAEEFIQGIGSFDPIPVAERLDLIPANQRFATVEIELMRDQLLGIYRLKRAIAPIEDRYDYIVCDCSPSLGIVTLNAMLACPEVIVPVQLARIAVIGALDVQKTVAAAHEVDPACRIVGYLPTFAHEAERESREAIALLKQLVGDAVFKTSIHRATAIAQAMGEGHPVLAREMTGRDGRAADEYRMFTWEVVKQAEARPTLEVANG